MPKTLEQQIAEAEDRLSRLREKGKKKDNRQKIVTGAIVITEAKANPKIASWLLKLLEEKLARDIDKTDFAPLLDELRSLKTKAAEPKTEGA